MGAWGPGLQANDTALDFLEETGLDKTIAKASKKGDAALISKHLRGIKEHFKYKKEYIEGWRAAVLGVAEYMLDNGLDHSLLATSRDLLEEAVTAEKEQDELDCWSNPEERLKVLENFLKRLNGEEVSQAELDESNRGLIDRICDKLP